MTAGIDRINGAVRKSLYVLSANKPMMAEATKLAPTSVKPKSTMSMLRVITLMVPPNAVTHSKRYGVLKIIAKHTAPTAAAIA